MKSKYENEVRELLIRYNSLPYTKTLKRTDLGTYYAKVAEIPDCAAEGRTPEEALKLLDSCLEYYFIEAIKSKQDVPTPTELEKYSGKFNVRLTPAMHYSLAKKAMQENISLNQVTVNAINNYLQQA